MGGGSRAAEDSPVRRRAAEGEVGTFPAGRAAGDAADSNPGRGHWGAMDVPECWPGGSGDRSG